MNNFTNSIDEMLYDKCSAQEEDILKYLKENLADLPKYTLSSIADNTYCSTTSVTRLIKKLGFDNYRELQYAIKMANENNEKAPMIGQIEYSKFVGHLDKNQCIYIYGKGASQISAHYLFRKLLKAGYNASLIDEIDLLYSLFNRTVIIISNSGHTSSVIETVQDIKAINRCQIFAITRFNSELSKIADESLLIHGVTSDRDNQTLLMQEIDQLNRTL